MKSPSPHSNTESVEQIIVDLQYDTETANGSQPRIDQIAETAKDRLLNLILATKPELLEGNEAQQAYNYALQDWEAGIRKVFNKDNNAKS